MRRDARAYLWDIQQDGLDAVAFAEDELFVRR